MFVSYIYLKHFFSTKLYSLLLQYKRKTLKGETYNYATQNFVRVHRCEDVCLYMCARVRV